ncbi:NADP-dependent fatty aldehyde dehydrogenase [Lacunisphaera limnophila]|uniref:NADP-dependent fatty aldehyde dehydrogenase n=1 Tax=Lacunisphaera limnophila TaxID=1838286 RepID=A0A1D8AX16_9BACT|nr:aldehyde dehydrogenase (NADP(+)) [Lacunisphaera limnophila]AOS45429.1 NADP-dependent fatty aldehyde dehydrogenase [Lacunisphaera limnophila]
MKPDGGSLIGFGSSGAMGASFKAFDPAKGTPIEPSFLSASAADVARAAELAAAAAPALARLSGAARGKFLRAIAANLETKVDDLVARAMQETALAETRLRGEVARTAGQLRLYAESAERGDWLDARIETALPERKPLPKPDHRSMMRPLGPVVVFGSSNFPFAYSVAGGDTASALATGCPVIVKAHPAHPGTSELTGRLILHAVRDCGLPEGTFSLLFDAGFEVGQALVQHPLIKAAGFTGSVKGGRALTDLGAARPEPIPVYAEMGSVNPVFILPGAIGERAAGMVEGLYASAMLGVGQFCTNPGLIVLQRTPAAEQFVKDLAARLAATLEGVMLTPGIRKSFVAHTTARAQQPGVKVLAQGNATSLCSAAPVWFETEAMVHMGNPSLAAEIFGPSSLVVWCKDRAEMLAVATHLEGSLTATVHVGTEEAKDQNDLIEILATKAGRIVFNAYPTGVEVSHAMVHGGPYPATSDGGRTTSVGTRALGRWARPVCYQGFADGLLPAELQNANPLGVWRLVNGELTKAPVG